MKNEANAIDDPGSAWESEENVRVKLNGRRDLLDVPG